MRCFLPVPFLIKKKKNKTKKNEYMRDLNNVVITEDNERLYVDLCHSLFCT